MRIYLSSLAPEVLIKFKERYPNKKVNTLVSFGPRGHRNSELTGLRDKMNSLILDSGVWTINNAKSVNGKILNVDSYISYVKLFGHKYDFYINFDEDFTEAGFEKNYGNQLKMENAGLSPVPVVHDIYGGEIDLYIDRQYPIVALGSSQTRGFEDLEFAVEKLSKHNIKIHLFGKSMYSALAPLPIWSCDSSNWTQQGPFGYITYWNENKKAIDKTDYIFFDDFQTQEPGRIYFRTYAFRKDLETYLDQSWGITYDDLMGYDSNLNRQLVNMLYYVELQERVSEEHLKKGFSIDW